MTAYLSVEQVLELHHQLVKAFGGSSGLRDRGALEAALARPAMTFGGDDLYTDLATKTAAMMHSLVLNHPFLDGNKRTSVGAAELFLNLNGSLLEASDHQLEDLTIEASMGHLEVEALAIWFRQRLRAME